MFGLNVRSYCGGEYSMRALCSKQIIPSPTYSKSKIQQGNCSGWLTSAVNSVRIQHQTWSSEQWHSNRQLLFSANVLKRPLLPKCLNRVYLAINMSYQYDNMLTKSTKVLWSLLYGITSVIILHTCDTPPLTLLCNQRTRGVYTLPARAGGYGWTCL